LARSIAVTQRREEQGASFEERETLRAGVIQNFEVSYELAWKVMKRWLAFNIGKSHVEGISIFELYKLAAANKLIASVEQWFNFHKARNMTSHEYGGDVAQEVYACALEFLPVAQSLASVLEAK
jgi:nucleotidyltransferase substrate binding protein (TIGR01987 family)